MVFRLWIVVFVAMLGWGALAQPDGCDGLVNTAIDLSSESCRDLGRNQMCYGHYDVVVSPWTTEQSHIAEKPGDRMDVFEIQSMRLMPLDTDTEVWGVALLQLQANLPDTVPGQNVTVVLFGDVAFSQDEPGSLTSKHGYYLKTGITDQLCEALPDSGVLVQTPEGVGTIDLLMNDVNISLGSTMYIKAIADHFMSLYLLEGTATIEVESFERILATGEMIRIPMDEDMHIDGMPEEPERFRLDDLRALPLKLLKRPISLDFLSDMHDDTTTGHNMTPTMAEADPVVEDVFPPEGEFFFIEPNCTEMKQTEFPSTATFYGYVSYGYDTVGPRPWHEIGMSVDDVYSALSFYAALDGQALSPAGEKERVVVGRVVHIGQRFYIGRLAAGTYTYDGRSRMRSFRGGGPCVFTVFDPS